MNTRRYVIRAMIGLFSCGLVFFANGGDTPVSAKMRRTAKAITVLAENDFDTASISANCSASTNPGTPPVQVGAMPLTQMTLAIQYSSGADMVQNENIQIFVSWTDNDGPGINLSTSSGVTDAKGKCYVTIKGSGQKLPDGTQVKVYATHRNAAGTVDASNNAFILVMRHNSVNSSPTPILQGVQKLSIPITYDESALTGDTAKYVTLSSQARSDLTAGHVSFTNQIAGASIKYSTFMDSTGPFALTTSGSPRVISYNVATMDDTVVSSYVPFEKRNHTNNTADHELCHALFLDHHPSYERSLMWSSVDNYFVWGTVKPRADSEWLTISGPDGY